MKHTATDWRPVRLGTITLGAVFCAVLVACAARPAAQNAPPDSSAETGGGPAAVEEPSELYAGGLTGSKHDFSLSDGRWKDLCTPCHTPHEPTPPTAAPPGAPPVRFVSYAADPTTLDRSSVLCLSCHDGVTAQDVFSGAHALSWATPLGTSTLPISGRVSHPIGVRLPLGDPTYRSPAEVQASGRIKLPGGRVQCISCHDPHNTDRHPAMLVQSNRGSQLCLACHRI
ncbi:MAG: cytochrome c3 family protein [Planctomycetia bacterium]|nr:MAG: cytochrome c3 family protein [Planctomycetia bacterium]RIK71411.1 MAG: hypothetical protein DCC66_02155 [Planctomycetota bacterium]